MSLLDFVPTWGIFLITLVITFACFEGGFLWGKARRKQSKSEQKAPISTVMGATLGLVAFILAFTFGFAASRFQERWVLVVDDANAIETTYRRAEYLSEPQKTQVRDLLYEYVSIRKPSPEKSVFKEMLEKTEEIQSKLWNQAVIVAKNNSNSIMAGLFIQSLNQMFDLHLKRVLKGAQIRIPIVIWGALYFITILSMLAMGYYAGLLGGRSILINLVMILSFSGVIFLIADLDSPQAGVFKVSQQPLTDLLRKMSTDKE